MLNIVIIIAGIAIGFVFQRKRGLFSPLDKLITYAIWLLLFLLGFSVGSNQIIISNLGKLGFQAVVITFAAITGSVLISSVLFILLFKNEK